MITSLYPLEDLRENRKLYEWAKRRLDKALEILTSKEFIILLGFSTAHKRPPINKHRFLIEEAVASADYLVKKEFLKIKF